MKPLTPLFMLLAACTTAQAQTNSDTAYRTLYKTYMTALGATSNLYSGSEYTAYYPSTSGTPFWNAEFHNGSISYEGIVYNDIAIAYDLVANEVLIRDAKLVVIKLDKSKIDWFTIAGHTFAYVRADTSSANSLPADIYDMAYDGRVKVFVKRKKQVSRNIGPDGKYPFMTYNAYFVYKGDRYYSVSKKNDLLKIFGDKGDAIKEFWKDLPLSYKNDPVQFIVRTADFFVHQQKINP